MIDCCSLRLIFVHYDGIFSSFASDVDVCVFFAFENYSTGSCPLQRAVCLGLLARENMCPHWKIRALVAKLRTTRCSMQGCTCARCAVALGLLCRDLLGYLRTTRCGWMSRSWLCLPLCRHKLPKLLKLSNGSPIEDYLEPTARRSCWHHATCKRNCRAANVKARWTLIHC